MNQGNQIQPNSIRNFTHLPRTIAKLWFRIRIAQIDIQVMVGYDGRVRLGGITLFQYIRELVQS